MLIPPPITEEKNGVNILIQIDDTKCPSKLVGATIKLYFKAVCNRLNFMPGTARLISRMFNSEIMDMDKKNDTMIELIASIGVNKTNDINKTMDPIM